MITIYSIKQVLPLFLINNLTLKVDKKELNDNDDKTTTKTF